ncbi:MAG: hypothetical protein EU541_07920 [Promethearchaeota archaeon]|nr:MAG: hypothetical protein EU541_07920 [Candidatus Lokiarchaeota archaeon]
MLGLRSLLIKYILSSSKFKKHTEQHIEPHAPYVNIKFQDTIFTIHNPPSEPLYSSWIGGLLLSSLKSFEEFYITKKAYESNPSYNFSLTLNIYIPLIMYGKV